MPQKKYLIGLITIFDMLSVLLGACSRNNTSTIEQPLVKRGKDRISNSVINSLINQEDARVSNIKVEFQGDNVVVLSCKVAAKNSFGGMSQNIFEYIYTSNGEERVDNVSAGSTPYSKARALAADSLYTNRYKRIVEKELLYFMTY